MPISVICPHCHTTYEVADDLQGRRVLCRECEQLFIVEGPSAARSTAVPEVEAVDEGSGLQTTLQPADTGIEAGDGVEIKSTPPKQESPPNRSRTRAIALVLAAFTVVAGLIVGTVAIGYTLVRERYNPWVTQANWQRIEMDLTLREVESIVGKGKTCPMGDMNSFVKPQDVSAQTVKLGVAGCYRWRNGDTHLFVGVDSEDRARFAFLLTQSVEGRSQRVEWFVKEGEERPTGKSVEAKLPEEKLVEAYIREQAGPDASIEIATWGPHDLRGELRTVPGYELIGERRRKPVGKVRVRYWAKGREGAWGHRDELYYIQDGEVFGSYTNALGDKWLEILGETERRLRQGR